jgi:hypothetical protein
MVGNTCNPSPQEPEVRGLRTQGQPGLCTEILFQKTNKMKESPWMSVWGLGSELESSLPCTRPWVPYPTLQKNKKAR